MHLEGQQGVDRPQGLVEAPERNHRAQVAPGANQSRDAGQLLWDHEGHDAVARALRHLHEEREEDEHDQRHVPRLLVVDIREGKQEDCLEELGEELGPNAARECKLREEHVAHHSAERPGEEVHQAEAARKHSRCPAVHLEVHPEVRGKLRVHGQLRPEARGVLEDHHHHPEVLQALHVVPQRGLGRFPCVRCGEALGGRGVPALPLHHCRADQEQHRGNAHGCPPCGGAVQAHRLEGLEEAPHDEDLGHAAAEVAPACGCGVGGAHHIGRKHQRAPELVRDERGSGAADHGPDKDEAPVARDARSAEDPERPKGQEAALRVHRPKALQDRAQRHAHEDRHGHGADGGQEQGARARRPWAAHALWQDVDVVLGQAAAAGVGRTVDRRIALLDRAEAAVGLFRLDVFEFQEGCPLGKISRRIHLVLANVDAVGHVQRDRRQGEPPHKGQEERERGGPEGAHVRGLLGAPHELTGQQVQLGRLVVFVRLHHVLHRDDSLMG
mmetsp:Transcript_77251/g.214812  ORF Transcript_77251/g.214812 Transcript_77251/m.214812 type:complete len:499 (-) Transcript_77251:70-1566(-)